MLQLILHVVHLLLVYLHHYYINLQGTQGDTSSDTLTYRCFHKNDGHSYILMYVTIFETIIIYVPSTIDFIYYRTRDCEPAVFKETLRVESINTIPLMNFGALHRETFYFMHTACSCRLWKIIGIVGWVRSSIKVTEYKSK